MPKERIYFCQGCSAVLTHRVNYCPHCGDMQIYEDEYENCGTAITENDEECPECYETIYTDEEKERYCPWCGYNLDTDGRDLDLKYCNGVDCGKELGGLIRYSENTGEPLSVEEILSKNDYVKEISDWLSGIYNEIYDGYFPSFTDRMLYIYDKTGKYTVNEFKAHFGKILDGIYIHTIPDFYSLFSDAHYVVLEDKEEHPPNNYRHCLCVIGIEPSETKTDYHTIFLGEWGHYNPKFDSFENPGYIYKPSVSYIFISSVIPELTKIGSMYEKYFLTISPEILQSLDISKIWQSLKKEQLKKKSE